MELPIVNLSSPQPVQGTLTMPGQHLDLTTDQQQQIAASATAMLRAAVSGQSATFPAHLAEVRDRLIHGAFISLKRGKHLRSCCGSFGQQMGLAQALENAAIRVIREDLRFPPVSPTELDFLDVEVWLLHNPQPVQARGEERLGAVIVGKHGTQVMRGQSNGLFLPSVAVDNNWDTRRLLDHVCVKAGLPPTAWKDDATALFTFEGLVIRPDNGQPAAGREQAESAPRPAPYRQEDVLAYAEFCRGNLATLLTGGIPNYYFFGAADGQVAGVVLSLRRAGGTDALHLSQLSLRPGVPLQATLFTLTQAAAQQLASERIERGALVQIETSLTILHDPVLHGTVGDPHLAGLDPHWRAVLVIERNKAALLFDPARTPEALLAESAVQARVTEPATAAVFSLGAVTTASSVSVTTAPKPVRGPAVRPPAVAGTFYESDPDELARTVDQLLSGERRPEPWPAALVPHAGLKYSGAIAAGVLQRLHIPRTVIVLGPKHTALGMDWAVAPHQTWALPGASLESDFVLARRLCQAIPGLEMDAAAHQGEHGIEVELPLLARLAPEAKVVGIAIGHATLEDCLRIAGGLAELLREREERPLLLVSSDMNHFATDAENRRLDAQALAALEERDPARLYETVTRNSISMCGLLPAVIVLETLRLLGLQSRTERVGYATTADVTGDTSRVVGYAGMLFG